MENQKSRIPEMSIEQARDANRSSEDQKIKRKSDDQRRWKPVITKDNPTYQALVRTLPAGVPWLENQGLSWAVEQHTHYIKEPKYNLFMTAKCRKTLGAREKCPICEQNWAVWRAAKTRNDELLMKKMSERGNKVSFIGNILVVKDLNNKQFNGEVKLWEHTKKLHDRLQEPLSETLVTEEETEGFIKPEKKELFIPYHPRTGRNFIVIVKKDEQNASALDYSKSRWHEEGCSPIADSDEKILAILERCYDLREFLEDVPSAEDLVRRYQQFNDRLNDLREPVPGTKNYVPGADSDDSPAFEGEVPTGPVSPNAKQGDSKEYFKPANSSEPPVDYEPEQDDGTIKEGEQPVEEDELPF